MSLCRREEIEVIGSHHIFARLTLDGVVVLWHMQKHVLA